MKKKEKRMILILLAILAVVVAIFIVRNNQSNTGTPVQMGQNGGSIQQGNPQQAVVEEYVQVLGDGTKLNISERFNQAKSLGTLSFTNIQLTNKNGQTVLLADVENKGSSATEMQLIDISMLDKNGQELGKVGGIVSPLQPGGKTQFNVNMMIDYTNAYDFKIVAKGE